jgi:hypothetical protein
MKTETALVFPTLPKDYAGLCRLQMPRPIHDRVEYANVAEVTDKMSLWQDDFTVDQAVGSLPRQPGTIHLRNSGRRGPSATTCLPHVRINVRTTRLARH